MKKILGMGNALVDILMKMKDDHLLKTLDLPKGSMQLVDENKVNEIVPILEKYAKEIASGGSAANTINGLAALGAECGYIGKVGNDAYGKLFSDDMMRRHIANHLHVSDSKTGTAFAFISPDGERTFATFLGAAVELSADDLDSAIFTPYQYFHIEGYLVQNHDLISTAVQMAGERHTKVSMDMASYNVVENNRDFLIEIIKDYVDIVFANEEEAAALTGLEPEQALDVLSTWCEVAVVKVGARGSYVKTHRERIFSEAVPAKVVDTTGAGDLYAAGFLHGMCRGLSMQQCADSGSLVASRVIGIMGARMDQDTWADIMTNLPD
jgi:sugar/nucleoside kinase (ribokinase family)